MKITRLAFLAALLLASLPAVCRGDDLYYGRAGQFDLYFSGGYSFGDTNDDVEIDDLAAIGMGFGYGINDHININSNFHFSQMDIDILEYNSLFWDLNLDWYILDESFTPMIAGGAGLVYYRNDDFDVTISETSFTYNIGAGFRWDISESYLLKCIYRATFMSIDDVSGDYLLSGPAIQFGMTF